MYIGLEVEGRYKGKKGLFIQENEIKIFLQKKDKILSLYPSIELLYFMNPSKSRIDISDYDFNKIVVVEDKILPKNLDKINCFVYNISENNDYDILWQLRPQDAIKFHKQVEGHLWKVIVVPVSEFIYTWPDEYVNDEEINLEKI